MAIKLGGSTGNVNLHAQMMKGEDGGYYIPSVDENANLTWYATEEDMPAVPATNIKGPKGDKGDIGVYIGDTEPTDDSIMIWLNVDAAPVESAEEVEY